MQVTVFTGPGCTSCARAKAFLRERHIEFIERDIATDAAAMNELVSRGCRRLPVILVGDRLAQGFSPEELQQLLDGR
jgi:glutaredoxin